MITLRKAVPVGCEIPAGYRVAWIDYYRRAHVTYPIGLHLIAMLCRWAWVHTFWVPRCMKVQTVAEATKKIDRLETELAAMTLALRLAVHEYATGGDDIVEMWIAAAREET